MLLSYSRPDDIAFSLIGTGSAWLSDDAGAALADGRPASVSRLQWLSGAQTTASELILRASWAKAFAPRIAALLGVTLPEGTMVKLAFRRPADSDYTYLAGTPQQRVVTLPDGSRCAWFVLDDALDPVIGIEYHLVNDVNGSAEIAAAAVIDLGEAWIGPAVEIPHERGWSRGINDSSVVRRSLGGQVFGVDRPAWRTLQLRFSSAPGADVLGEALANDEDWGKLEAALKGAAPCVALPRWLGETADYIQRTAIFGYASAAGPIQHAGGDLYGRDYSFEEVPAQG